MIKQINKKKKTKHNGIVIEFYKLNKNIRWTKISWSIYNKINGIKKWTSLRCKYKKVCDSISGIECDDEISLVLKKQWVTIFLYDTILV